MIFVVLQLILIFYYLYNFQKSQRSSENRREALSLSIFGDEMADTDEPSVFQGFPPPAPTSSIRSVTSLGSNLSINDLWNLYSQAEQKTSPNSTPKASENKQAVLDSNLVAGDDDFNDDSWEFKDASHGTGFGPESMENNSSSHVLQVSGDGQQPSPTVLNPELIDGDDGFEDDSWEFKDAFSVANSQCQASLIDHRDLPTPSSTKLEPPDYVDFYCKLKEELCNAVLFHLHNLKVGNNCSFFSYRKF